MKNNLYPLAPATLHILLALSGEDLHGYGIMQQVEKLSDGRYKLGPGTLYDNLEKMLGMGLIEELPREAHPRRRYYRLTASGGKVLSEEIRHLEAMIRRARNHVQQAFETGQL
jgi:DNA-binding PadR family transcriptional regulator